MSSSEAAASSPLISEPFSTVPGYPLVARTTQSAASSRHRRSRLRKVPSAEAISALECSLERLQAQAEQLAANCALPKAGRLRGRSRP